MPLYEYRCTECEHRFEILQRMGEGAEGLSCPECGKPRLEKQFSTFSGASGKSGSTAAASAGVCGGGAGFT